MNFVFFRHLHSHRNSAVSYISLRSGEGSQLCVEEFLTLTLLVEPVSARAPQPWLSCCHGFLRTYSSRDGGTEGGRDGGVEGWRDES